MEVLMNGDVVWEIQKVHVRIFFTSLDMKCISS